MHLNSYGKVMTLNATKETKPSDLLRSRDHQEQDGSKTAQE